MTKTNNNNKFNNCNNFTKFSEEGNKSSMKSFILGQRKMRTTTLTTTTTATTTLIINVRTDGPVVTQLTLTSKALRTINKVDDRMRKRDFDILLTGN